jgi:uncharacterized protein YjbI with pentapeptide repeats
MAIDPKDLGELQKALNDAAGKASVLWTTFISFQLYLAIAFGSVTHRDLFLETPIKLPLLNVDLPLVGFFVVAPTLLVIFHFYVFLELLGLAATAKDYNMLLVDRAPVASDRQYLRQRLHSFLVLRFLAGPRSQRTGFDGLSLRLIVWITLVGTPLLILLQAQVTFLPYHREWIVWLQRAAVLSDLAVIWYFWLRLRSDDDPIFNDVPRKAWTYLGAGGSFCVVIFSAFLATFPGEMVDKHLPELRYLPTTWQPHWSEEDDWTSLQKLLFKGEVDEVSGRPRSMFSNRLVLTDQSFVADPDKLDKVDVSHRFRGRDLRLAVLDRADLRKADFTGAILNGAWFKSAKLQSALFGCARTGNLEQKKEQMDSSPVFGCTSLQGADLGWAQLQGANLDSAELQGADFSSAQLQGADLSRARLQGAVLNGARLQGANLDSAELQGADLSLARLQGADLHLARLQGADLSWAHLQGANLSGAQLQGADLDWAHLQGTLLENAKVWRARAPQEKFLNRTTDLDLTDLKDIDADTRLWDTFPLEEKHGTFTEWRDAIANGVPAHRRDWVISSLAVIDPGVEEEPDGVLDSNFWETARSSQVQGEEREKRLTAFLTDLACSSDSAPYVARGLLQRHRLTPQVADKLRQGKSDPTTCPGVNGFTDKDWAHLSRPSF